jgi:hypothetical protein
LELDPILERNSASPQDRVNRFTPGLRSRRIFTTDICVFDLDPSVDAADKHQLDVLGRAALDLLSLFTIHHFRFTVFMMDRRGRILVDTGRNDYSATFAANDRCG